MRCFLLLQNFLVSSVHQRTLSPKLQTVVFVSVCAGVMRLEVEADWLR